MASGIVIIDKPADWTSMDVCAKLRGILKERRVGHGGTLDPMATGVLPVFVGSATRAVEFAEKSGKTLEERPVTAGLRELEEVLPRFTGPIEQVPPMFSAIKIKGQKLYELARAGKEVERKPRPVTIHALEVLEQTGEADYRLLVRCSKGTYVRTLCHDIGAALGCGGCMSSLRRTEAAGFTIEQAVTIEEVQAQGEALLLPVDRFFAQYPAFRLTEERLERLCRNGNPLPAGDAAPGTYRVYAPGGTFLCLSRWEKGQLVSVKNFFGGKQAIITP